MAIEAFPTSWFTYYSLGNIGNMVSIEFFRNIFNIILFKTEAPKVELGGL